LARDARTTPDPLHLQVQLLEWLVARLQPGMVPQPQLPIPGLRDGLGSTAAGGD
jgi:hypothetical protein